MPSGDDDWPPNGFGLGDEMLGEDAGDAPDQDQDQDDNPQDMNGAADAGDEHEGSTTMSKTDECEFYLGEHSTIEGATLEVSGTAQIDGTFSGKLKSTHLVVGEKGRVSGEIVSETGDIEGIVEETITLAGKLTVRSTGRIKGEITYGALEAHEGAQLVGSINTQMDTPSVNSRSSVSNVRAMLSEDTTNGATAPMDSETT